MADPLDTAAIRDDVFATADRMFQQITAKYSDESRAALYAVASTTAIPLVVEIVELLARVAELEAEQQNGTIPAGWTGLTAEVYEAELPREPVYVDGAHILPDACGMARDGLVCTRPAGHPYTKHIARNGWGDHCGEWDANPPIVTPISDTTGDQQ